MQIYLLYVAVYTDDIFQVSNTAYWFKTLDFQEHLLFSITFDSKNECVVEGEHAHRRIFRILTLSVFEGTSIIVQDVEQGNEYNVLWGQ